MKPIRGGLVLGVGVLLLLLALFPAISWATFPGDNGRIAYVHQPTESSEPGGYDLEIFTISPRGGDPTQLTDNSVQDLGPSWSADGRKIAFSAWDGPRWGGGGDSDVWTMSADGTDQRQVTDDGANEVEPSFSPSGGRIVVIRNRFSYFTDRGNVVTMRRDGTDPIRLTTGQGAGNPEFSPNGRRIVFNGAVSTTDTRLGIWKMRPDGSRLRLLVNADREDAWPFNPHFSPDGSHIIYTRCGPEVSHQCSFETVVMRSSGRFKHPIAEDIQDATFSPSGRRIVGAEWSGWCSEDPCGRRIVTMSVDGTDIRKVTQPDELFWDGPWDGSPAWQPIPQP